MDDKPLTTEDLYGVSKPAQPMTSDSVQPLKYEETPVIDPVTATPQSFDSNESQPSTTRANEDTHQTETPKLSPPHSLPRMPSNAQSVKSHSHTGLNILAFILLFVAGIWLSSSIRPYLPSGLSESLGLTPLNISLTPTPIKRDISSIPSTISPTTWKSYDVISGNTKRPISGISYMLPPDVLPPICDGSSCASQGTYLPGGTRLTVAARGTGQILRDYRGTAISDVNGVTFTTKPVLVAGKQAMEYTGTFTGRTISGYAFTTMRGVMIPLTDTTSVEFNHFVPSGIIADFQSDDALFESILTKIVLNGVDQTQKGAVLVSITPTPTRMSTQSGVLSPTSSIR